MKLEILSKGSIKTVFQNSEGQSEETRDTCFYKAAT